MHWRSNETLIVQNSLCDGWMENPRYPPWVTGHSVILRMEAVTAERSKRPFLALPDATVGNRTGQLREERAVYILHKIHLHHLQMLQDTNEGTTIYFTDRGFLFVCVCVGGGGGLPKFRLKQCLRCQVANCVQMAPSLLLFHCTLSPITNP